MKVNTITSAPLVIASPPSVIANAARQPMDCHGLRPRRDTAVIASPLIVIANEVKQSTSKATLSRRHTTVLQTMDCHGLRPRRDDADIASPPSVIANAPAVFANGVKQSTSKATLSRRHTTVLQTMDCHGLRPRRDSAVIATPRCLCERSAAIHFAGHAEQQAPRARQSIGSTT